tara:strand:- start:20 stop:181 length:162 start_codon:yes stop_codon:yes gene_type:complete
MGPSLVQLDSGFEQDFSGFHIAMEGMNNYIQPDDYSGQRLKTEGYYSLNTNDA